MLTMVVLGLLCALSSASPLAPRAFTPLQLGQLAPQGWLVEQLITQANSLAGFMATSTFPGADHVNQSVWIGGDGSKQGGTTQWLPYWTNGQVPLVGLLQAAGWSRHTTKELQTFSKLRGTQTVLDLRRHQLVP